MNGFGPTVSGLLGSRKPETQVSSLVWGHGARAQSQKKPPEALDPKALSLKP